MVKRLEMAIILESRYPTDSAKSQNFLPDALFCQSLRPLSACVIVAFEKLLKPFTLHPVRYTERNPPVHTSCIRLFQI